MCSLVSSSIPEGLHKPDIEKLKLEEYYGAFDSISIFQTNGLI